MGESLSLAKLSEATRLLAECNTFDDAKEIHDYAEAARQYAKMRGLGLEAQNHAAELKLRAERRMGEMLRQTELSKGGRPHKTSSHEETSFVPTLADIGIAKKQSHRLQRIATLPTETFETYIDTTKAQGGELTTVGALKLAQQYKTACAIQARQADTRHAMQFDTHDFYTDLGTLIAEGRTFQCIYADPPWAYSNQSTRASTHNHYSTMSVEHICALPVASLAAPQCHLHLWTTNAFLFECPKIFAAWGFEFKSSFVWVKPNMGIGNYWRNSHELLLLGVRGGLTAQDRGLMSWLEAERTTHSAKPDRVRARVEKLSPGPYLELFGRGHVPGWIVWGNECLPTNGRLFHEEAAR